MGRNKQEGGNDFASFSAMVNAVKAKRARMAAEGRAKPNSTEMVLASRLRSEGLSGDALVVEIYKGLGGLMDEKKAAVNRRNEAKEKERKASR